MLFYKPKTVVLNYYEYKIHGYSIILVGNENGLVRLMVKGKDKEVSIDPSWEESNSTFYDAEQQLREYFAGDRETFTVKLNLQGTSFQKEVWNALMKIPYATCCTYKDVALAIGNSNASRAVGLANNKNPIPLIIPCHRVVGVGHKLVGYVYGIDMKQDLLNMEAENARILMD